MRQSTIIRGMENKRFVRRPEGARATSLGLQTFDKIAIEANAKILVSNRIALYDIQKVIKYIESLTGKGGITDEAR